jgi:type I restriction enzyme S subunit
VTTDPTEWPLRPFREVADYATGHTPARANAEYWDQSGDVVPWATISDLPAYGTVVTTKESTSALAFDRVFRGKVVPAGTLLMSFKLTIGRIATLGIPALHNEAIISIYPKPGMDQRFLGYYLSQVDYGQFQDRQIKGNTLNKSKIDRIPVPVPPEPVQRAIADVLDRVRLALGIHVSAGVTVDELKRAAMGQLHQRGLRDEPQRESELGPVPASWAVRPLGDVCTLSTGTTPSTRDASYYRGEIPFVKTADVVNDRISTAKTFISDRAMRDYSLKLFPPGTVLMAMYGQGKTRGQVSLLEIAATTTQNAAAIQPSTDVHPAFLWHYLMSQYERLRGMGSLGHVSHLNLGYLRELLVVVPPLADQQQIAAIFDALDQKIDLHRRKREVLEELFKSLLHKLMTREIAVEDLELSALQADKEPAGAVA